MNACIITSKILGLDKRQVWHEPYRTSVQITPVGAAIGIAISNSYNENSKLALGFQGAFNSFSGGELSICESDIAPLAPYIGGIPDSCQTRINCVIVNAKMFLTAKTARFQRRLSA